MNKAFYHFNCRWNYSLLALLIYPLSPFVGAVTVVLVSFITWMKQYRQISRRPLNWGFALLSLLLIVSCGFAENKIEAFLGLFNFLPFFLVFAAFSTLIQTTFQLRQMAWALVIGSMPVTILGLGQLFLGWNFKLKILWIVLEWTIAPGGNPPGRIASLFLHANTFAAYLVIVFIVSLGLWLEQWKLGMGRQGRQGSHFSLQSSERRKPPLRLLSLSATLRVRASVSQREDKATSHHSSLPFIFLTIVVIMNFITLIFTNSRNGWAIAIFTCLAYALYQGWRILVGGVVGIVTSVLLAAFAPSAIAQFFRQYVPAFFWARLNDDLYPDRPVALMRKTQWEFAWSLAWQHPWTGWGLRSFTALYKAQMQIKLGHPHNLFLMLSAETGFIATFVFCSLLGCILITGVQLLRNSKHIDTGDRLLIFSYLLTVVGWILLNTVDVTLFDFRLNTLSWLILAATCGVVNHYKQQEKLASN